MSEDWHKMKKLLPIYDAEMGGEIAEETDAAEIDGVEVKLRPTAKATDVEKARREVYVEAIKSGMTPAEAADTANVTTQEMNRDPAVIEEVTRLLADYNFTKEKLKEIGRARMARILLKGDDQAAIGAKKALDAEDGNKGVGTAVQINISQDTREKFDSVKDFEVPGLG